jgi:hypothetical protein
MRFIAFAAVLAFAAPIASPADAQNSEQRPTSSSGLQTKTWAHYEAMKKRWREDRAKFDACNQELAEAKKKARMSVHRQVDFMEHCMLRR